MGGSLIFSTPGGGRDLYAGNANAPRLLQYAPEGDWIATTYVRAGSFDGSFQTAGSVYWFDAGHYIWFGIGSGRAVQGIWQSESGRVGIPWLSLPSINRTDLYLRITCKPGRA